MRHSVLISAGLCACFLLTVGCKEKAPSPQELAAPDLFSGVTGTLAAYTDSLMKAPDSLAVERLMEHLTDKLTKVNFNQPANTDLALSEDENDSIYKLTSKLMSARADRLEALSKDSLPADTLTLTEKNTNKK